MKTSVVRVLPLKPAMKPLIETLMPFWQFTYFIGALPDWCCNPRRALCSKIANGVLLFVSLVFMGTFTALEIFQLYITIVTGASLGSLFYLVSSLITCTSAVTLSIYFTTRRKKLSEYFKRWNTLEGQSLIQDHWPGSRTATFLVYSIIAFLIGAITALIIYPVTGGPDPSQLHNHLILRPIFNRWVLVLFQSIAATYAVVNCGAAMLVPSLVYYQAGLAITALESATRQTFHQLQVYKFGNWEMKSSFHQLWHLYERIRRQVAQANDLFGFPSALMSAALLVLLCLTTSRLFLNLNHLPLSEVITLPIFSLIPILGISFMTLIASQLERSSRRLASTTALLMSENICIMAGDERHRATLYLNNIQTNILCARPWDLFDINYSLILSTFSFVVTYTIIILQSV